jgi:hypothetical protein
MIPLGPVDERQMGQCQVDRADHFVHPRALAKKLGLPPRPPAAARRKKKRKKRKEKKKYKNSGQQVTFWVEGCVIRKKNDGSKVLSEHMKHKKERKNDQPIDKADICTHAQHSHIGQVGTCIENKN